MSGDKDFATFKDFSTCSNVKKSVAMQSVTSIFLLTQNKISKLTVIHSIFYKI